MRAGSCPSCHMAHMGRSHGAGAAPPAVCFGPARIIVVRLGWYVSHGSHGRMQGLLLLLCAAGPKELNEVRLGPLTPQAVAALRHIRDIMNVTFSIKPEPASRTIFLQCVGAGLQNLAKGLK
jgi:hypothetical protein